MCWFFLRICICVLAAGVRPIFSFTSTVTLSSLLSPHQVSINLVRRRLVRPRTLSSRPTHPHSFLSSILPSFNFFCCKASASLDATDAEAAESRHGSQRFTSTIATIVSYRCSTSTIQQSILLKINLEFCDFCYIFINYKLNKTVSNLTV